MRHNRAVNHLGRQSGHRKAMLANMASSLILKKRITTTEAKAKALKPYLEGQRGNCRTLPHHRSQGGRSSRWIPPYPPHRLPSG